MHIQSIPMCTRVTFRYMLDYVPTDWTAAGTGSSNNYAYLVVDEKSKDAVVVDPANPPESGLSPETG